MELIMETSTACFSPERLRQARLDEGLTQETLASRIGANTRSIVRWEAGISVPQPRLLAALADALGVRLRWLRGY